VTAGPTNSQDRRDVFKLMLDEGLDLAAAKAKAGIKEVDAGALRDAVRAAIANNPKAVADFKGGKDAAKMKIVGEVMKAHKGTPNDVVRGLVDEELAKV
jgi:aspartyl-tRNA(Asn)/glutamyl-tRNA(Gln) amidotransferase subunit B